MARNPDCNVLIGEIVAALKAMSTGSGYNYTQDANYVYDWLDKMVDQSLDKTIIDVRDEKSSQEINNTIADNVQEIHITIARAGDSAREIIRKTKQDVLTLIFATFDSGGFTNMRNVDYLGDERQTDREGRLMAGSDMVFNFEYKTQRGQI